MRSRKLQFKAGSDTGAAGKGIATTGRAGEPRPGRACSKRGTAGAPRPGVGRVPRLMRMPQQAGRTSCVCRAGVPQARNRARRSAGLPQPCRTVAHSSSSPPSSSSSPSSAQLASTTAFTRLLYSLRSSLYSRAACTSGDAEQRARALGFGKDDEEQGVACCCSHPGNSWLTVGPLCGRGSSTCDTELCAAAALLIEGMHGDAANPPTSELAGELGFGSESSDWMEVRMAETS